MKRFQFLLLMGVVALGVGNVAAQVQKASGIAPKLVYSNPIIHADYSDPDAIAVGNDYYMTASSFNAVPGLPLLHSKDLVHWNLIGYALQQLIPADTFNTPQHGKGVWAPSIRYHNNEFFIFYPDPDFGIYVTKAKKITGPWSMPVLVEAGKGLIDPCPLWDDDGKVYLVHAYAGSRAGFKSILVIKEMNREANKVIGNAVLVYDGHQQDATVEGPKLYKRNGYYYIFAPAGGVATGWQLALRSKNIYGPYERKIVLQQGVSNVNGPHQGAWVHTAGNEDWFLHFQEKEAYGRIVHLQPMYWKDNWPVIGTDQNGDGIGEPVSSFARPVTAAATYAKGNAAIPESDEFNYSRIGLQWQWQGNPQPYWAFCSPATGTLRMNAVLKPNAANGLWQLSNLLLQKFPAEKFSAIAKLSFTANTVGERFSMQVMGLDYAGIGLVKKPDGVQVSYFTCAKADKGGVEQEQLIAAMDASAVYLQLQVDTGGQCRFGYSKDGVTFTNVGNAFTATPGKWIGAKFGFACTRTQVTNGRRICRY